MPRPKVVFSAVEHGWQAAREWSATAPGAPWRVVHLSRGWLAGDLRALITPQAHVALWPVPRRLFRICLWGLLAWWGLRGRLAWVLVDNERTFRRLARPLRWGRIRLLRIGWEDGGPVFWSDPAARARVPGPGAA